ncbi:ClpXP adapter SpxH family protein [Alkalibacillus haloalkaliphilus]|uniref:ClpXP adapter SpxH family protein n=1 Tax=Alkalibacillus haloalkaliphilus TaxID=94136 RepID=UPI0002D70767|nr:ClpXP adapter SpxH family protein [Alkalibacillus haloalkaliphilus]
MKGEIDVMDQTADVMNNLASNDNSQVDFCNLLNKPVEIYLFVDPLCPDCWSFEPYIKKLAMEYGCYFKLRTIVTGKSTEMNVPTLKRTKSHFSWRKVSRRTGMNCDNGFESNPVSTPILTSLAIKAAELQGQRLGTKYLRKLREYLFLDRQNISDENVLIEVAEKVNLDVEEFKKDLHSKTAKKALKCDIHVAREMEVEQTPAMVMFNREKEEDGLKVCGLYNYDTYIRALFEVMDRKPRPSVKPELIDFLNHFEFVASKEVSVVFDWSEEKTEKELKKLQLSRNVDRFPVKHGTFWKYIKQDN